MAGNLKWVRMLKGSRTEPGPSRFCKRCGGQHPRIDLCDLVPSGRGTFVRREILNFIEPMPPKVEPR